MLWGVGVGGGIEDVWGSVPQSVISFTWVMLNLNFSINWMSKLINPCYPRTRLQLLTRTLPLSSVRPTSGCVLSGIIFAAAHSSAGRQPSTPWPCPSWNTVPEFGIVSSSAIFTPLRSYSGRPPLGAWLVCFRTMPQLLASVAETDSLVTFNNGLACFRRKDRC